ncbi:MAG: two-component system NtrC family sensor kinase [Arcticibacterium sp.]
MAPNAKTMKVFLTIFSLMFFFQNKVFCQTILFQGEAKEVKQGFSYLPDSLHSFQAEDIILGKHDEQFIEASSQISITAGVDEFWLKLSVKNDTDFDKEIVLDFENWAFVDFYYRDANGLLIEKKTGHNLPFFERDYPVANKNYIQLALQSNEILPSFIKLTIRPSVSKIPQDLGFKIASRSAVDSENNVIGNVIFAFLGIFTMMFFYNLFVFFVSREKSYGYYLLVLLFAFILTSINSGYIIPLFGYINESPIWISNLDRISSSLGNIAYLFFVSSLFKTEEKYPKSHKFLKYFIAINLAVIVLFFINIELAMAILFPVTILIFIFIFRLVFRAIRDKNPSAKYFLFGFIANISMVICIILVLTGVLPKNNFTYNYSVPAAFTLEVIFFSFALANMISYLRKDNEQKQKRIIEQLMENQQLQSKVNRELEEKVNDRTQELNKSIGKLRETQDQLILKEKLASLGEMTSGIAHEIQNPLNFVNNFSELSIELAKELKEEVNKADIDSELVIELVDDINSNQEKIGSHGLRASNIVKSMLEHTSLRSGERTRTNINHLAEEFLSIAYNRFRMRENNIILEKQTDFDPVITEVSIVTQDIGRVFLNLYNNAFFALNSKVKVGTSDYIPKISVITKKVDQMVEIKIRDNGIGISTDIQNKIFQPFFTTKPTGEGSGLGLSISYEIITKGHQGELLVNSVLGEFSEFIIYLPLSLSE